MFFQCYTACIVFQNKMLKFLKMPVFWTNIFNLLNEPCGLLKRSTCDDESLIPAFLLKFDPFSFLLLFPLEETLLKSSLCLRD